MNIALWIVTGFLALGFLTAGISLLVLPPQRYRALHESQHWVDDLPAPFLKFMGVLKVAAATGLVLPVVFDVALWLVPLAALGLMMFMTGAVTIRVVRREWTIAIADLAFIAMATFVAWGRAFGPEEVSFLA